MTTPLSLAHPADRRWQGSLRSLLRFVVGFLFICHGSAKVFGVLGGMPPAGHAVPFLSFPFGVAGIIELVGGVLLLIGLFTQPVAFICSGEMAVAYFMVHAKQGFFPLLNHGEPTVLYCFVFLYLAFAGGGPYSVDALMRRDVTP